MGTHWPSTSFVFQPTWSTCMWVQITWSIVSGPNPAATRSSKKLVWRLSNRGVGRGLSLPTQVSTMIRCPCDSSTRAWIRSTILPFSSMKSGVSQG